MAGEDLTNGHSPDDMPEIEASSPDYESDTGNTPSVKGLYVQPFPGGNGSNPIDRYMRGSGRVEELIPLTNVQDWEISRDERIMYFQNIANFANGKLDDVMKFGYNLRRARNGQTARDIVTMVSGQRQQNLQDWRERQNRVFNRSRTSNPLTNASEMAGS